MKLTEWNHKLFIVGRRRDFVKYWISKKINANLISDYFERFKRMSRFKLIIKKKKSWKWSIENCGRKEKWTKILLEHWGFIFILVLWHATLY